MGMLEIAGGILIAVFAFPFVCIAIGIAGYALVTLICIPFVLLNTLLPNIPKAVVIESGHLPRRHGIPEGEVI